MLWHWSQSVWWCKRKLMLRLRNQKTKTVTMTLNLVLELKHDTVNKKNDNALPDQAGRWDLHLPDRVSYLPRAVGQSLLSYPDFQFSYSSVYSVQLQHFQVSDAFSVCWVIVVSIIHRMLTWTRGSLTCMCDLFACVYRHTGDLDFFVLTKGLL